MINFEKNIIKIVKNNTPSVVSVNVFKNKKIEQIIKDAVKAAVLRSKKLSEKNK